MTGLILYICSNVSVSCSESSVSKRPVFNKDISKVQCSTIITGIQTHPTAASSHDKPIRNRICARCIKIWKRSQKICLGGAQFGPYASSGSLSGNFYLEVGNEIQWNRNQSNPYKADLILMRKLTSTSLSTIFTNENSGVNPALEDRYRTIVLCVYKKIAADVVAQSRVIW